MTAELFEQLTCVLPLATRYDRSIGELCIGRAAELTEPVPKAFPLPCPRRPRQVSYSREWLEEAAGIITMQLGIFAHRSSSGELNIFANMHNIH